MATHPFPFIPSRPATAPDAIVILGHGERAFMNVISPTLYERLALGVRLYRLFDQVPILVTGGTGRRFGHPDLACSVQAREYLMLQRDIDVFNVHVDALSRNTVENALQTKVWAQTLGLKKLMIVTSEYHWLRSKAIFSFIFDPSYSLQWRTTTTHVSPNRFLHLMLMELVYLTISLPLALYKKLQLSSHGYRYRTNT